MGLKRPGPYPGGAYDLIEADSLQLELRLRHEIGTQMRVTHSKASPIPRLSECMYEYVWGVYGRRDLGKEEDLNGKVPFKMKKCLRVRNKNLFIPNKLKAGCLQSAYNTM